MTLTERIQAFVSLGEQLKNLRPEEKRELAARAANTNAWFDERNITSAFNGIIHLLDKHNLEDWLFVYDLQHQKPKKVGVVMAGNIPMVGFHDMLSVLISGHHLYAKLSSDDTYLMEMLVQKLITIAPRFAQRLFLVDKLKDVDAIIATGSDNTSRYFEYYFANKPHIIRRNRTSLGLLTGTETTKEIHDLGRDIFQYYGLGCRNVSKIFVPEAYDFTSFFKAIESYQYIINHHKYRNNYDYNKSIYLVNRQEHLDNGFLLLTPSEQLVSPISVLYYESYSQPSDLIEKLEQLQDKTQCIVTANGWYSGSIAFGQAQCPAVWDFADGVDTMAFLKNL